MRREGELEPQARPMRTLVKRPTTSPWTWSEVIWNDAMFEKNRLRFAGPSLTLKYKKKHSLEQRRRSLFDAKNRSQKYERAVVSRVLGRGFPLPLNPAVENTTCTLRTDTDSNRSWDMTHKTIAVINVVKSIHIRRSSYLQSRSSIRQPLK